MPHGDFVWCDLSARQVDQVCAFYQRLFGWRFDDDQALDGSAYRIASASSPIAGIYQMPQKFDDMGMPCFWMPYIEVASASLAVEVARQRGGKVEVGPISGAFGATIALIRDPLGSGFTVIESEELNRSGGSPGHGDIASFELHVSDAGAVIPFYQELFGWTIKAQPAVPDSNAVTANDSVQALIRQVPDDIRGKSQYWSIHFSVADIDAARAKIRQSGSIEYEDHDVLLAKDPDGASFFLTKNATTSHIF